MMDKQIKKIEEQLRLVSEQFLELEYIRQSIGDLSEVKKGKEILCPISSGIFVKAKITDPENFFVNVGSNIVVKKDTEGAQKMMESQAAEIEKTREALVEQYNQLALKMQEIEKELV